MGHVIAIANMKGGVGKTTTTVTLAETLAARGKPTLVIDLDQQANASVCLVGIESFEELMAEGCSAERYFAQNIERARQKKALSPMAPFIATGLCPTVQAGEPLPIALLAASADLHDLEREVIVELTERGFGIGAIEGWFTRILKSDFDRERQRFEYILCDCPPGISPFAEAAIRLSDLVIAPTIPDFISVQGLPQFCNYLKTKTGLGDGQRKRAGLKPWVLATKVRAGTREHAQHLRMLRQAAAGPDAPFRILDTEMPERVAFPQGLNRANGFPTYQEKWDEVVDILDALADEIEGVLHAEPV